MTAVSIVFVTGILKIVDFFLYFLVFGGIVNILTTPKELSYWSIVIFCIGFIVLNRFIIKQINRPIKMKEGENTKTIEKPDDEPLNIKKLSDKSLKELSYLSYSFNLEQMEQHYPYWIKRLKNDNLITKISETEYIEKKFKMQDLKEIAKQLGAKPSQKKTDLIKFLLENHYEQIQRIISNNEDYGKIYCLNKDYAQKVSDEIERRKQEKTEYKKSCISDFLFECDIESYERALDCYLKWSDSLHNEWENNSFSIKETHGEFIKRNSPILKTILHAKKPKILDFIKKDDYLKFRKQMAVDYFFRSHDEIDWNYQEFSYEDSIEIFHNYIMQKIKLAEFRKNGIKKCELSCRFGRKCQLTQKELMLSEVPEMPMNECLLDKESMCMGGYLGAVVEFDF